MDLAVPLSERAQRMLRCSDIRSDPSPMPLAPRSVRDAAAAALDRGETHYTDRPGIQPLREAVARDLNARYDIGTTANAVVITCGDTEARFVPVQQLLPPGGTLVALTEDRSIEGPVVIRGGRLEFASSEPDERLHKGADVFYLDAAVPKAHARIWLARLASSACWIIYDLSRHPEATFHPVDVGMGDRTVTIGGLGYAEGLESWRVGFLAASQDEAKALRDFKQALTICTTSLSQWAALALLEEEVR